MLNLVNSGTKAHLHFVGLLGKQFKWRRSARMRNVWTGLQDAQNVEPKHNVSTSSESTKPTGTGQPYFWFHLQTEKVFNHQNTAPENSTGSDYLQSDAAELKQLLEIEHF